MRAEAAEGFVAVEHDSLRAELRLILDPVHDVRLVERLQPDTRNAHARLLVLFDNLRHSGTHAREVKGAAVRSSCYGTVWFVCPCCLHLLSKLVVRQAQ